MIESDSAGTLFAEKNLCLSFMSLETRIKKLAGREGEMFCQFLAFPRILPVTASWLFMSPQSSSSCVGQLSYGCGPCGNMTGTACTDQGFPLALSASLSKTLMYIFCARALCNS